jgi:hypothetical protein
MSSPWTRGAIGKLASLALLLLLALLLTVLDLGLGAGGALGDEEQWTEVTLVYESDIKGKIEPCG